MSALKVERLFLSLSSEERQAFRTRLHASQPLLNLYDALETLASQQKRLSRCKRQLIESLYHEPYTPTTDTRFRNDCRRLSEQIECFLAERQCLNALETNSLLNARFLLEALLERGLWQEFEENYRKACTTALLTCTYESLLAIDNLYFEYLWKSRTHKQQALEHLLSSIEESKTHLNHHYATTHAHWGFIYTAASHYLQVYEQSKSWEVLKQVDFTGVRSPLTEYYEQKSLAFARSLQADVPSMQKALNIIFSLPSISPSVCTEQLLALGNLGLAYMLNDDYSNALKYYQKAFEFSQTHRLEFGESLAFNYASVLMKCARYKDALEIFRAKWDALSKGEMMRHRAEVMRCYCHIFLGEPDMAKSLIPSSLAPYPSDTQYYFHFANIAIFFERGEILAAERAVDNLLKRFQRRKPYKMRQSVQKLSLLYRKFLRLYQAQPNTKKSSLLKKLKDALSTFKETHRDYHNTLPVVWLEHKLSD
jgi:tetratricopeptide (TPR) repeat protein